MKVLCVISELLKDLSFKANLVTEGEADVIAFQVAVAIPQSFECVDFKTDFNTSIDGILSKGMLLSNKNGKGNKVIVAFASATPVKFPANFKIGEMTLKLKDDQIFDIDEKFSGFWGSNNKKMEVEYVDSILDVDGDVSVIAIIPQLNKS